MDKAPVVVAEARARESPVPEIESQFVAPERNHILLLNFVQSVDVSNHVAVADAKGILKVCTDPDEEILKLVPPIPIANV